MNYNEAIAYILGIPKFTKKNSLEHTRAFLKALGHPEQGKKVIHVAGTNGKGSVCSYMQSLLFAEKKTVGFFTSPHLVRMNERIRINGDEIRDELFLEVFEYVFQVVQSMVEDGMSHPTFFEFLFGMGMVAFDRAGVEYIILETGLGGRLDATNAIEHPTLTVITSLSLDHTEILGDTMEQIAFEKGGIIKKHVPVIFDADQEESRKVLLKIAKEQDAPCREISKNAYEIKEITSKYIAFSSTSAYYENNIWKLDTQAVYQAKNAMLALAVMRELFGEEKHLAQWQKALFEMHWEGRMEEVLPGVILDGAHNPGAIEAFIDCVRARVDDGRKRVILFSAVREKAYDIMIRSLCENVRADAFVLTEISGERGVDVHELAEVFRTYTDVEVIEEKSPEQAFEQALQIKGENGQLYCLGSLYLIGTLKAWIAGGNKNA